MLKCHDWTGEVLVRFGVVPVARSLSRVVSLGSKILGKPGHHISTPYLVNSQHHRSTFRKQYMASLLNTEVCDESNRAKASIQ